MGWRKFLRLGNKLDPKDEALPSIVISFPDPTNMAPDDAQTEDEHEGPVSINFSKALEFNAQQEKKLRDLCRDAGSKLASASRVLRMNTANAFEEEYEIYDLGYKACDSLWAWLQSNMPHMKNNDSRKKIISLIDTGSHKVNKLSEYLQEMSGFPQSERRDDAVQKTEDAISTVTAFLNYYGQSLDPNLSPFSK